MLAVGLLTGFCRWRKAQVSLMLQVPPVGVLQKEPALMESFKPQCVARGIVLR